MVVCSNKLEAAIDLHVHVYVITVRMCELNMVESK